MTNGGVRSQSRLKTPLRTTQSQASLTTNASSETQTFLQFVRMLAGKSDEERRMLVQVAEQEAAAGPAPRRSGVSGGAVVSGGLRRTGSAGDLRRNPLRWSASLDGSDFGGRNGGGLMVGGGSCSADSSTAIGFDGRPQSADGRFSTRGDLIGSGGGGMAWGGPLAGGAGANGRANPLRQRQAQARAAAAAAQLQQQFIRRAAAATLQAHWRGWQHRRLARYLRARRKRAMRLDWLWHLEYVTNLMQWHEAAHTVQAHWRGRRDPELLDMKRRVGGGGAAAAAASSSRRRPSRRRRRRRQQQHHHDSVVTAVAAARKHRGRHRGDHRTDRRGRRHTLRRGGPISHRPCDGGRRGRAVRCEGRGRRQGRRGQQQGGQGRGGGRQGWRRRGAARHLLEGGPCRGALVRDCAARDGRGWHAVVRTRRRRRRGARDAADAAVRALGARRTDDGRVGLEAEDTAAVGGR